MRPLRHKWASALAPFRWRTVEDLLISALTDEHAVHKAPPALVLGVENIYEEGDQYFAVEARAGWTVTEFAVSILRRDGRGSAPRYQVAGFVAHENRAKVAARQRMRFGH